MSQQQHSTSNEPKSDKISASPVRSHISVIAATLYTRLFVKCFHTGPEREELDSAPVKAVTLMIDHHSALKLPAIRGAAPLCIFF